MSSGKDAPIGEPQPTGFHLALCLLGIDAQVLFAQSTELCCNGSVCFESRYVVCSVETRCRVWTCRSHHTAEGITDSSIERATDSSVERATFVSGSGRKSYTVHGSSFEVPNKYNLIKAVGYGAYGLVCSAVNSETQEKVCVCCHVPSPATETRENVLLCACYLP